MAERTNWRAIAMHLLDALDKAMDLPDDVGELVERQVDRDALRAAWEVHKAPRCTNCGRILRWCDDAWWCPGCGDEWPAETMEAAR